MVKAVWWSLNLNSFSFFFKCNIFWQNSENPFLEGAGRDSTTFLGKWVFNNKNEYNLYSWDTNFSEYSLSIKK